MFEEMKDAHQKMIDEDNVETIANYLLAGILKHGKDSNKEMYFTLDDEGFAVLSNSKIDNYFLKYNLNDIVKLLSQIDDISSNFLEAKGAVKNIVAKDIQDRSSKSKSKLETFYSKMFFC